MNRTYWGIAIALTVAALAASVVLYPILPEQVPTHWNIHGQVDATGAKSWAAFLLPGVMAAMLGLFALLPWLSPKHFEVERFRPTYLYIMAVVTGLFAYIHAIMLVGAVYDKTDVGRWLVGGIFLLLALIGNVLGRVRRNFYIGVRVPWTLASERVWNETHRLAAWMFVACGLIGFALIVAGLPVALSFGVFLAAVIVPVVYSLLLYKRLERRGEG